MKYFGEYLVSKAIITEEILVSALVEQMSGLPTPTEILFHKKALDSSIFLRAFIIQHEKKIDFKQACIELSVWNSEIESIVSEGVSAKKIPLGQILIEKRVVDLVSITKALDEYLSKMSSPKKPETVVISTVAPPVDSVLLDEATSNLNEVKLNEIKNQCEGLYLFNSDIALQKLGLNSTLNDFHFIRGNLRSIQVEKFESLFMQLETVCLLLIERVDAGSATDLSIFGTLCSSAVEMLIIFTSVLKENSNEQGWFLDSARQSSFNTLLSQINEVQKKVKS